MGAGLGPQQQKILKVLESGYLDNRKKRRCFIMSTHRVADKVCHSESEGHWHDTRPQMRTYHSLRGLRNRGLVEMSGGGTRSGRYWKLKTQIDLFESYKRTKANPAYDDIVKRAMKVYEDIQISAYKIYEERNCQNTFDDYYKIERQAWKTFKETEARAWNEEDLRGEKDLKTQ